MDSKRQSLKCICNSIQKLIPSSAAYITGAERASNAKDGLDKLNCHVTCKQKTALLFQVNPIKDLPKQKHTAKLAALMLKSNRNKSLAGQFGGNCEARSLFQACKMRVHKQTQSILDDCTRRSSCSHCSVLEPHVSASIASRLYNHLF